MDAVTSRYSTVGGCGRVLWAVQGSGLQVLVGFKGQVIPWLVLPLPCSAVPLQVVL
jgi:hypothetical protein